MLGAGGVELPQETVYLPDRAGNSMAHTVGTAVKVFEYD